MYLGAADSISDKLKKMDTPLKSFNSFRNLFFIGLMGVFGFSCSTKSPQVEPLVKVISQSFEFVINYRWVLVSPMDKNLCTLSFIFQENGNLKFYYRGFEFNGTYDIDRELTHYLYINIPTRLNWNDDCKITPDYLSLYNDDTDFAWTVVGDFLYFQKMDKVLKFRKEIIG